MTALEDSFARDRGQSRDSMKVRLVSALGSMKQMFGSMSTSNSRTDFPVYTALNVGKSSGSSTTRLKYSKLNQDDLYKSGEYYEFKPKNLPTSFSEMHIKGSSYQQNSIFASQDCLASHSNYQKITENTDDIYQNNVPRHEDDISPNTYEEKEGDSFTSDMDSITNIQENLFSESSKQLFKSEKFNSVYDFQQKSSKFPKKSSSLHEKLFSFSERISSKSKGERLRADEEMRTSDTSEMGDVPGSLSVGSMSINGSVNGSDTGSMSVSGSVSGSMSASGKGDSSSDESSHSSSSKPMSKSNSSSLWNTKQSIHIFTNPWCEHPQTQNSNISDLWNNNQRMKTGSHPPDLRSILHHTHRQDCCTGIEFCTHTSTGESTGSTGGSTTSSTHTPSRRGYEKADLCENHTDNIESSCNHEPLLGPGGGKGASVDQATMTEAWMDQYSSDSEIDDEELTCRICDRAFDTQKDLHKHQTKKRHWGCDFCGEIFNSEIEMEYHKEDAGHWSDDEYDEDDCEQFVTCSADIEHVYGIYSEDSQSTDSNLLLY